jgi:hypothetical protein
MIASGYSLRIESGAFQIGNYLVSDRLVQPAHINAFAHPGETVNCDDHIAVSN